MRDRSLEEINVLKLVIYVFSFISVCTALILFILLPILKNYKDVSLRLSSENSILSNTKNVLDFNKNKLEKLKIENNISFSQFETQVSSNDFYIFLSKYFKNIKLSDIKITCNKKYLKEKFQVSATMNNQAKFYFFMDELKKYKNLVKITYPMTMKVTKDSIYVDFKAEIYSAK